MRALDIKYLAKAYNLFNNVILFSYQLRCTLLSLLRVYNNALSNYSKHFASVVDVWQPGEFHNHRGGQ